MVKKPFPTFPLLIIDDEPDVLISMASLLKSNGINNIITCRDSREVMNILENNSISVILLDLQMPHISGEELLLQIRENYPQISVIVITGFAKIETAVQCMKIGAYDYLTKPITQDIFTNVIQRTITMEELKLENQKLKKQILSAKIEHAEAFSEIITKNQTMLSIFQYIEAIAESPEPILITGESGAGKELIAKAVHLSGRQKGDFIPVNIAGLDDEVFTDTLFGHKRGAFTGADSHRPGLIEKAANGTLFLDEIGDLKYSSQVKLLRLLQEKEYYPIGSDLPYYSEAKIITSTNADLAELMLQNKFRKDLYYRLNTHHIMIPALRERKEDIPLLIDFFLGQAASVYHKSKPVASNELYSLLSAYHFPGNIRELRSIIFDAVSTNTSGLLSIEKFKNRILRNDKSFSEKIMNRPTHYQLSFPENLPTLKALTQLLINEALLRANGSQVTAARLLGITPQAMSKRLKNKR